VDDTSVVPGQSVTVDVGSDRAGTYVAAFLYSAPVSLGGWTLVDADGVVDVDIPTNAPAGEHRIAIQDAAGTVIGWTTVTVLDPSGLAATGTDPAPGLLIAVALIVVGAGLAISRRRAGTRS
jgi:5'-nucleotidase